jgi:PAS domain S-box-containing protein
LVAAGYFAMLLIGNLIPEQDIMPTALLTAVPLIFSVIVWSHVRKNTELRYSKDPAAYKQLSTEMSDFTADSSSNTVINAIGDGVLAIDAQGVIQLMNPAAQTVLGWDKNDAVKLQYESVLKLIDENDKPLSLVNEPIKQALNTNQETRANHLKLETKNGKKLFIALVASPLGDAGSGVIVVVRDITKERAEEHEQAEFISTASHEMRTPVASIEGYLGLALNPNTATIDEKARDFINKAHESAQHLGRLFQDLLDVSKAEDGRLSNNPRVLDIVAYTGDVVEGLRAKAEEKGLQLIYKPAPNKSERGERSLSPVFYVNLDKDHVREIVNNLTENAIKYTPSGEVSIDISGSDEFITISITDSGIGIPAEDIPHLFQKFYRVDNTDTREIGGTGLGLYLCRRLAETMGGRIWVESQYKQGSTFHIELPRISSQQAQQLKEQQDHADATAAATVPSGENVFETPAPQQAPEPYQRPEVPPAPVEAVPVQPQPQPQPAYQPPVQAAPVAQPIPVAPVPTPIPVSYIPPEAPQNVPQVPQNAPQRMNVSLTTIEQNPAAYAQATRKTGVSVPPRGQ